MCGIAGQISRENIIQTENVGRMIRRLRHRGPDDSGCWIAPSTRAVLGHARLAIIDLSPSGHQPFLSADGQVAVVFNGEIYNFLELKTELLELGFNFVSSSDTEVLLAAYLFWGEQCLERLNGMFAFAIWDERSGQLFAARDRLGEKPFKYCQVGEHFIFASEVKALFEFPGVKKEIDFQAIDLALSLRFVSASQTGFKNIYKLPAGHYLLWRAGEVTVKKYWQPERDLTKKTGSLSSHKNEVWSLFKDSVSQRMISDVPIGAFLSGGIDSTSVVAAMHELGAKNIETFVISLGGQSADQKYAGIAAKYFGTNHHEIELPNIDYRAAVVQTAQTYDEPFFDQSALPNMLISQEMKKHVTVVLSGDGGDELFGGYDSYRFARFARLYNYLPKKLASLLASKLSILGNDFQYKTEILNRDFFASYAEYFAVWKNSLPKSRRYITKDDLYLESFKAKINRDQLTEEFKGWFGADLKDIANAAMRADINGRLADGYLPKIDFASMASAVEVRAPFLDYRLVELAQNIPSKFKIKGKTTKHIWKEIINDKLPREIIERPKAGFSIPLHLIIKNELKEMMEDLVLTNESQIANIFSVEVINRMWQDHLAERADYSNHLWSLLMLELWLRK